MKSRRYTIEFKKQAVELAESLGSILEASRQLGIPDVNIHNWKKKFSPVSTEGQVNGEITLAQEVQKLKRENADLKKVNYILKAAAAFFSQDHLK